MRFFAVILIVFLGGCATVTNDVGARVEKCCPGSEATTFSLEAVGVPKFLEQLLVSNLSSVLSSVGMQPLEQEADLAVTLRYEQDELAIATRHNDFDERVSEGGDVRFVARIVVEMMDVSGNLVFQGSVQRIHDVSPGEYMHTGNAAVSIHEAFQELLTDLRL